MTWHISAVLQTLPAAFSKWITKSAHGQTGGPLPNTCQPALAPGPANQEHPYANITIEGDMKVIRSNR